MKNYVAKIKKCRTSPYMIYILMFILVLLIYLFCEIDYGDDSVYTERLASKGLWESLIFNYNKGRSLFCRYWYSVIYAFLRKFADGAFWKPALSCCYAVISACLVKIFSKTQSRERAILACSVIFLIPHVILSETGWLSTSSVYLMPTAFAMVGAIGMIKTLRNEKISIIGYVIYAFCVYMGCAHEQLSAFIFFLFFAVLLLRIMKQKKCSIYSFILTGIAFVQMIIAVTWPANDERVARETAYYFPDYGTLNIVEKFYLAFQATLNIILRQQWMPLLVLSVMLMIMIWQMHQDKLYQCLGVIPVLFCLMLGPFSSVFSGPFPYLTALYSSNVEIATIDDAFGYVSFAIGIWLIGNLLINIYLIFGKSLKCFLAWLIFLGGLCTRFIMGLSASLYASGSRTSFVLYVCVLSIIYMLLLEYEENITYKRDNIIKNVLYMTAAMQYLNWLCRT